MVAYVPTSDSVFVHPPYMCICLRGKRRSSTTFVGRLIIEWFGLNKANGLKTQSMLSLHLNIVHGHRIRMFNICNIRTPSNMVFHHPVFHHPVFQVDIFQNILSPEFSIHSCIFSIHSRFQIHYSLLDFIILMLIY